MKELDANYKLTVKHMLDFSPEEAIGDFKVEKIQFGIPSLGFRNSDVMCLTNDSNTIFKMDDGLFILEKDEGDYYCSEILEDLITI